MTAKPTAERGPLVRAFVQRLRRARAISAALRALVATGLPVLCLVLLVALLLPAVPAQMGQLLVRLSIAGAVCVAMVTVIALSVGWARASRTPLHELVRGLAAAGRVPTGVLADELATWVEQGRRAAEPMAEWLGRALEGDLAAVPDPEVRRLGRRRLGRLRYLLPLCVVLLLAWWLRFWPSPVPGMGGGANGPGGVKQGEGKGGGAGAQQPQGQRPQLPPPPEPKQKQDEPPPVKPEPPAPVLPLPQDRQFVVPQFIDDGPSRRELAHVAEVPEGSGNAAGQVQRAGGGAEKQADRPDTDFQRAEERALRLRHVPEAERPMVERFFGHLREGRK
jgi:hypothetical protein